MYKELFNLGVHLVFLKEPHISTDVYRETLQQHVAMTGTDIDVILKGVNEYLMILAEKQIHLAFQAAQQEVNYLRKRTSEGVRKAQLAGKRVGTPKESVLDVRKRKPIESLIRKYSRDFDGNLTDVEVMAILRGRTITVAESTGRIVETTAGIARNTYYKYKREMHIINTNVRCSRFNIHRAQQLIFAVVTIYPLWYTCMDNELSIKVESIGHSCAAHIAVSYFFTGSCQFVSPGCLK